MKTRKDICTYCKIQTTTFDKIVDYLNIDFVEKYHEKAHKNVKFYSDEDFEKIKNFINENDTRKLFNKLTKIKNYGSIEDYNKFYIEKVKQTKLERYGDENYCNKEKISNSNKIVWTNDKNSRLNKVKQTKLEKYGNENYNNITKNKQTKLKQHDDENYNNRIDFKKSLIRKYGSLNNFYKILSKSNTDKYRIDGFYTINQICEKTNRSLSLITKIINYLNLDFKEIEYDNRKVKFYSDDVLKEIIKFLNIEYDDYFFYKRSCLKNNGVEFPFQSEIIKNKSKETCLQKYGVENVNQSELIRKKIESSNLIKYGATTPLKSNYVKSKIKQTNMSKYGKEYFTQTDEFKNMLKKTYLNKLKFVSNEYISIQDLSKLLNKDDSHTISVCKRLNIKLIRFDKNNNLYICKKDIHLLNDYFEITKMCGKSYSEKEVLSFIQSICHDEIIENSKSIIPPKELDIYIPSKKLAVEFDGLFWHNELHIDNNYHLDKTNSCNSKEIDLIHIFEDDWLNHKDIVKSMIASRLGIYERRIFARKCEIKTVDKELCKKFFDENHLQGFAKGDIYLGLFYNDELIQSIIINKKGWHDRNVELTRMVTKINTQVVGGFSKLMKHLVNDYNFNSITSYVYKAWFNGKGYKESGFKVINENKPSYSYIVNDSRLHKSKFRKEKIKKLYEEGILKYWNEKESEHENMLKNGIFRIYDCGTIKVEYNRK